MNARTDSDVLQRCDVETNPVESPVAITRTVWRTAYGEIVIEVIGDDVYVDGDRVEPHAP